MQIDAYNVDEVGDAEEEDLRLNGHWNVLTARLVDVALCLL